MNIFFRPFLDRHEPARHREHLLLDPGLRWRHLDEIVEVPNQFAEEFQGKSG
jgi:hypothetical protein